MNEETKKPIPMLPVAHWWTLRQKFKQSIPGVVTDGYLATVLEMGANSARANVLPFLKILGIIDNDGKPKERARLWRDDSHYPKVCGDIVKSVYPQELIDAVPDPVKGRDAAMRWFGNYTGSGEGACRRMAALYAVLVEAKPTPPEGEKAKPAKKRAAVAAAWKPPVAKEAPSGRPPQETPRGADQRTDNAGVPSININLQVHISADASPDQIEQMFAAMAKHIYKR